MTLLLVLLFAGVLACSFFVIVLATRPRAAERRVQSRLKHIRVSEVDRGVQDIVLAGEPSESVAARLSLLLERYRFARSLEALLRHAGSSSSVGWLLGSSLLLSAAAGGFAALRLPTPLVLAAALLGALSRYALLRFQGAKRLNQFNTALPDAIEMMARALRAGHSMPAAIEMIAEQSPQPLAREFAECFQQQKFGIPLRDALLALGGRVPSQDLQFLITAVLVQKETGGDLTEILDRTTLVIRDRVRIQGEVRTYTAQGRLTGWILGLLPFIMLALINIVTPGYSTVLFHDPLGQKLLYAAGGLILVGGFFISRIVDIKV